ncbi:hypothetical protein BH20ACT15_BH20ACT15_06290 [soil metagenome]
MPTERKPNQFARVAAVAALALAFVVVIASLAGSGGGSNSDGDEGDGGGQTQATDGPTKKGERAVDKGVWIVRQGDTLVSISEETGIDLDELESLNPDLDPQTLSTGQRIALAPGLNESNSGSGSDGGTINEGAGIGDGTGEGDGGPTLDDSSDGTSGN